MYFGFWPAKILNYDQETHTAQIHIAGITDGITEGVTADFAYAVGENDRDSECQVLADMDVSVYFERGQPEAPVIAFYRSHRKGGAKDVRRIRQKNIELLATSRLFLKAPDVVIEGNLKVIGNVTVTEDVKATGSVTAVEDVKAGNVSLKTHIHTLVQSGRDNSGVPQIL